MIIPFSPRVPPHLYFVVSAVFHYLGPSFAVLLFARGSRSSGWRGCGLSPRPLVFGLWRRPWRALRGPLVLAWGRPLAAMNCCFYEAISRLALGTVAAIEFLPVIALAAFGARNAAQRARPDPGGRGCGALSDVHLFGQPLGFVFALVNAGLFALYIVLAHRAASRADRSGLD